MTKIIQEINIRRKIFSTHHFHSVNKNQYLLCNQAFEGFCELKSNIMVDGICINIKNELMELVKQNLFATIIKAATTNKSNMK